MTDTTNPYRPGEPVADPAMLFGRQNAADWIEMQLLGNARTLVLSAQPLVGKTSFIRQVGALQNLETLNLAVTLTAPAAAPDPGDRRSRQEGRGPSVINATLTSVIEQLVPQLRLLNLTPPLAGDVSAQPATALRELFTLVNEHLGSQRLVLYFDDLHLLLTHDKALIASFLSSLLPLLDECPGLHLVFAVNQDKLKQISHPLLDGAPIFNLGVLTADASLSMITLPVKNILRFDYGVTKRIAEINSHHPYYLCLFCHTLLNRQVFDGWVNQRDFDAALAEILDSPIEPFRQIWDQSTWAERAVLAGMAAIQGAHGPITRQEVTRYLQRQSSAVAPDVVIQALESLAERGVLAPMGALSYRFHVELLRFWLREHTNPAEILREVDWGRAATQLKPALRAEKASLPAVVSPKAKKTGQRRLLWPLLIALLLVMCLLSTGAVFAVRFLDIPIAFLTTPTATPTATPAGQAAAPPEQPAATTPPEPTATPTPTPPLVVARTLPSLTYMARDVDQSWRIYVMNADGTGATALSPEGEDDTAPVWSPDGQRIAFVSTRDGNREVYVVAADCVNLPEGCGPTAINVTRHPADDWTPSWSPDSKRLAFSSIRAGNWEIFILDMSCLNDPETCPDSTIQLTDNGAGNLGPVWSPDGSRLAFSSKAPGNWDLFTMTIAGSDLRQVTTDPANDLAPAWSPDGTRLAFETNRDGNVEVYVVDANGGTAQNVSNFSQANDHGPFWSPDGQQLVFYSNREGNWDIFSTTLDGQLVVNLTQTPTRDEQTPAWRP
ncbi:MAG: PD40 domain-containing protein [Anaerolineales bacterium]|nr:PD40 domain-containing protein [Anaerolineales bacterium]